MFVITENIMKRPVWFLKQASTTPANRQSLIYLTATFQEVQRKLELSTYTAVLLRSHSRKENIRRAFPLCSIVFTLLNPHLLEIALSRVSVHD